MVTILVIGLALAMKAMIDRRSSAYRDLSVQHLRSARHLLDRVKSDGRPDDLTARRVLHHEALAWKYYRATSQPWHLADPDPPEPE